MKIFFRILSFSVLFLFAASVSGQTNPTPTPTPENEEVIRISSDLVLVDALVLDKEGKQVKNLTPEDFEIYQDGKLQKITNFSYIDGKTLSATVPQKEKNKRLIPPPPVNFSSNRGRIITFVIDDGNCLADPASLSTARNGVKDFIDNKIIPGDRVAIYRTQRGSNLLQMYTSNKEVLKRVVNKVRWFPSRCQSAFDDAENLILLKQVDGGSTTAESEETKAFKKDVADDERGNQVQGTFGVLNFVIDRLRVLPERKIIFFVSQGIPVDISNRRYDGILTSLREIADKASRASVAFYSIDSKGLRPPGFISAADDVSARTLGANDDREILKEARTSETRALNSGMAYLADQTGGEFIRRKNFLEDGFEKVLEKETGYYLLGYQPDGDTFKGRKFHQIKIKLKRDDLNISSRKGFFGQEQKAKTPIYKNTDSPLYQAIASPFQDDGIDLRLTTMVQNNSDKGSYIRTLFHIKGEDLTFKDETNGMKKVTLDVVAVAMNEKGRVAGEFNRTYPIRIPKQGVAVVRQNGLDFLTDIPIKNSGFYSLRIAVRDENSKRLGSAGDYVRIRKKKDKKFSISNLLTTAITNQGKPFIPKKRAMNASFAPVFSTSVPSVRQYKAGVPFAYIYNINNARINRASGKPNLTSQFRIYKDGILLLESKETAVELEKQTDISRIEDYGLLRLNQNASSGSYVLQLIIRDKTAKKASAEWIDFEITNQ